MWYISSWSMCFLYTYISTGYPHTCINTQVLNFYIHTPMEYTAQTETPKWNTLSNKESTCVVVI